MEKKKTKILTRMEPKKNQSEKILSAKNNEALKLPEFKTHDCHKNQTSVVPTTKQEERPMNHKKGIANKLTHV